MIATLTTTTPVYGASKEGCWFDCCRGIYIGEAIIDCAIDHGFEPKDEEGNPAVGTRVVDYEFYHDLTDEAQDFMQQFAAEGFSFGFSEGGDWGLWAIEEDC
jgi:hypothetical protein